VVLFLLLGTARGFASGNITSISDTPSSFVGGDQAMHTIWFKNEGYAIGVSGRITIKFNLPSTPADEKFVLDPTKLVAASFGQITSPGVIKGGLMIQKIDTDSLVLERDATGSDIPIGSNVQLYIAMIGNPVSRRLNVQDSVKTYKFGTSWFLLDKGCSLPMYNINGPVTSFSFSSVGTQTVGQPFALQVTGATDSFGNPPTGTITITKVGGGGVAPDGTAPAFQTIQVRNGSGQANQILFKKEESVRLNGQTETLFSNVTTLFNVLAGTPIQLAISGEPTTVAAKARFANPITVTAHDAYGNLASTYGGTITFYNSDPLCVSDDDLPDPSILSGGTATFSGNYFRLRTAGDQKIRISDGTWADTTNAILVTPGNIYNYTLSVSAAPVAGQEATVTVTGAVDTCGNPASGTVRLSFNDGGDHSMGGYSPVLPDIQVVNGSGSIKVIFFKAESDVVLRGSTVIGSVDKTTSPVTINPGNLGSLTAAAYPADPPLPTSVIAGQNLGAAGTYLRVTVRDAFGNLKDDFTGSVYFTSTDPQAVLPYIQTAHYTFTLGDKGVHDFDLSFFSMRTIGGQSLSVVSGGTSYRLEPMQVVANTITTFGINNSTTQIAGQPFALQVINARDNYGNLANGTVEIRALVGGNPSPSGALATFTNIPVSNGSGSANQTLVKVEGGVRLIGEVKSGSTVLASNTTSTITMWPGTLGRLSISGTPAWVLSSASFPGNVTVNAYDAYGNDKSDYHGTIHFSTSDPAPSPNVRLPADFTFASANQAIFSGGAFQLYSNGRQTIRVADLSAGVIDTSDVIDVSALRINNVTSSFARVNRGQTNIAVNLLVENLSSTKSISDVFGELHFRNTDNRDADYVVTRSSPLTTTTIAPNSTRSLQFLVVVDANAALGLITVDGFVSGDYDGTPVAASGAVIGGTHVWQVQREAALTISGFRVLADTVKQGQRGIVIECDVFNGSDAFNASLSLQNAQISFLLENTTSISDSFQITPDASNLTVLTSGQSTRLRYYLNAAYASSVPPLRGYVYAYLALPYVDANSGLLREATFATPEVFYSDEVGLLQIAEMRPSQPTVTAGQTALWMIYIGVTNSGSSPINIDFSPGKTFLKLRRAGVDYTSSFNISTPTAFENGSVSLAGGETKRIAYAINQVASQTGSYSIFCRLESSDGYTTSDAFGSFEVQSADDVQIVRVMASRSTLTVNDVTNPWYVDVVLSNVGGSDVEIDTLASVLLFSPDAGFQIKRPRLVLSHPVLAAGRTDTLRFTVIHNGGAAGSVNINARIYYQVINTGETKNQLSSSPATVLLQSPANCYITGIRATRSTVTAGGSAPWSVVLYVNSQSGGGDVSINLDSSDSTYVRLFRSNIWQSGYIFATPTKLQGSGTRILKAGTVDSLVFPMVVMGGTTGEMEILPRVAGMELNRPVVVHFLNTVPKTMVSVQTPANPFFVPEAVQPTYVSAGRYYSFQLTVSNTGQSALELDPLETLLEFTDDTQVFTARLDGSKGANLPGLSTRTLYFNANSLPAGFRSGIYPAKITLKGSQNGNQYNQVFTLTDSRITVGDPRQVMITAMRADAATVTAGQNSPWHIDLDLSNNGSGTLKLDSARVVFYYGLQTVTHQYTLQPPDTFLGGGRYIRGLKNESLRFAVNSVAPLAQTGQIIIMAHVWLADSAQVGQYFEDQTDQGNSATVTVQSPASLQMVKLAASQTNLTVGQHVPWTVQAVIRNSGGSATEWVQSQSALNFSKGNANFLVHPPTVFSGSGGLLLAPGAEDSLKFTISEISNLPQMLGSSTLDAVISMLEVNSGRTLSVNSATFGKTQPLVIQDSARVRIDSVRISVPLEKFVNTGQQFYLQAKVTNPSSGDWVQRARVTFFNSGFSDFSGSSIAEVDTIAAGKSKWIEPGVLIKAKNVVDVFETFHARLTGSVANNTGESALMLRSRSASDTSITVTIQRPGTLAINRVSTSKDTIPSGYLLPWYIYVDVTNTGEGSLLLEQLTADDVMIRPGFVVEPPVLTGEDAILRGGETFRIVFSVTASSSASGLVTVTARVRARDGNDPGRTILPLTGQTDIYVSTTARVRIARVFVDPAQFNVDDKEIAQVNTKQLFNVAVQVENNGGQDLDTVLVKLRSVRSAIQAPQEMVVERLRAGQGSRQINFSVRADSVENLKGEWLTATVTYAIGEDRSRAIISPAQDSTAQIKIYVPAQLRITRTRALIPSPDKTVSYGQIFPVEVIVNNMGSESVQDLSVALQSNPVNKILFAATPKTRSGVIAGGDTGRVVFTATAAALAGQAILQSSIVGSTGLNTRTPATTTTLGQQDTVHVHVETAAKLRITSVSAPAEITAGDSQNNWRIYVNVINEGQADLKFTDLSAANITFVANGVVDKDYRVNAPAKLENADSLVLRGNTQDQLLYVVTRNGDIAGPMEIRVQLKAIDLNKEAGADNSLTASGSAGVSVNSVAWVRINQTVSLTNNKDKDGLGLVNRGKTLRVQVEAEAGELAGVDSVTIGLSSDGFSLIKNPTFTILSIAKGSKGLAEFEVTADDTWEPVAGELRETLTATILSAKAASSRLNAQIRSPERPVDATTVVRIQNPAQIAMTLKRPAGKDSILTAGEEFLLLAELTNLGTAPVDNGKIQLQLPAGKGFVMVTGSVERQFAIPLGQSSVIDTFRVYAPNANSIADTIKCQIVENPVDLNDLRGASIKNSVARRILSTFITNLTFTFEIYSPAGAKDRIVSTGQQVLLRGIVKASQNIRDKKVRLTLPVDPIYVLYGNTEMTIDSNPDTVFWSIRAPDQATTTTHTFMAEASGTSSDGIESQQKTVNIDRIIERADLSLEALTVSKPEDGVMENGQANFSVHQTSIQLQTRVLNYGKAGLTGVGRLTLHLQQSGLKLVKSDSIKVFTVGSFVTWDLQAADTAVTLRDVRVEMTDIPNDENTSASARVSNSFSTLNVRVEERGTIAIDKFYISGPSGALDNTLSAEQDFEVTAEISFNSVRDLVPEITWTGDFRINAFSSSDLVGNKKIVRWVMKAPSDPSTEVLTVKVTANDYRSSTSLGEKTSHINLLMQARSFYNLSARISQPPALTDRISSEVTFDLSLYLRHLLGTAAAIATDSFTVQLTPPASFSLIGDNLVKSGRDSLHWQLRAPSVRQDTLTGFLFEVRGLPRDANSGLETAINELNYRFPVWVVRRARLSLSAQVDDQPGSSPVIVRLGNEFTVNASLDNLGSADTYGTYQLKLNLPEGFTCTTPLQISTSLKTVSWRVKAPETRRQTTDTLVVRLLSAPFDLYSRQVADVVKDSASVLVSPEAGLLVAKPYVTKSTSMALRGGQALPMLGLTLVNKDESVNNRSLLDTLRLVLRNRRGEIIPANSVISRIAAMRHDAPETAAAVNTAPGSNGRVILNFRQADQDTIKGDEPFRLDIIVDILANTTVSDFSVSIDSASSIVSRDAVYQTRLMIADSLFNRVDYLGFTSGTLVIMNDQLTESFCNYPNPFGTVSRPVTKFVYYLKQASNVRLRIFTLTGDLVYAWEFNQTEHPNQTSAGIHRDDIVWDGRNGRGMRVMNGIYLAYLLTDYGERALTKIAVVK